jgi:hypothetical protein
MVNDLQLQQQFDVFLRCFAIVMRQPSTSSLGKCTVVFGFAEATCQRCASCYADVR